MDLFPVILKAFANTSFRTIDTAERPRLEGQGLVVPPGLLAIAAEEAFREQAFFFRESHLALLAGGLESSDILSGSAVNERLALLWLLKNAVVSSRGELPLCQDTGTAVIYGWKDEGVFSGGRDREALEAGAAAAYRKNFLRSSQVAPSSFFDEYDTGDNLPAQLRIEAAPRAGGPASPADTAYPKSTPAYRFLFAAKGGGSSNKTSLFSMTKALLEERAFDAFLREQIPALGTAACPPYRLAIVVGGTSPEFNLEVLKLATTEVLDHAPWFDGPGNGQTRALPVGALPALTGAETGWIWRDRYWEERAMEIGRQSGLGPQFGGARFLLDVRVLRLPRHAASCPVSIGVSCVAHRNILAYIDREGLHMERLIHDPAAFLRERGVDLSATNANNARRLNLERPIEEICRELADISADISVDISGERSTDSPARLSVGATPAGPMLLLSGKLLVARDAAHLKWRALLTEGEGTRGEGKRTEGKRTNGTRLPDYLFKYPIYYAGPSATPPGKVIGSLGPTTVGRMDTYAEELMSQGASLITLAKGNRSDAWKRACVRYGGFYLATLGGAAALLAGEHVTASEILDYPELGMEAVRLITVRDLPAFVIL